MQIRLWGSIGDFSIAKRCHGYTSVRFLTLDISRSVLGCFVPDNSRAVLVSRSTSLQRYAHAARVLAVHENKAGHSELARVEEREITTVVEQQTEKLVCAYRVGSLSMHFLVYGLGDSQCFVQRVARGGYTVGPRVDPAHMAL